MFVCVCLRSADTVCVCLCGDDTVCVSLRSADTVCVCVCAVVRSRLQRLRSLWGEVHQRAQEREAKLLQVLDLAGRFWAESGALLGTLRDAQDITKKLEDPAVSPAHITQQLETTKARTAQETLPGSYVCMHEHCMCHISVYEHCMGHISVYEHCMGHISVRMCTAWVIYLYA